ncbi:MAG: phosphoribosylformylglycinamidine synthase subunit PurS, partial [Rectinemataceae bacterium]|nr:phosphoribosylformylglycinamidine synthase subunit PurS [Rectinemataceae bacterium]
GARSSAVIVRGAGRLGLVKVSAVLRSEIYFVSGNIAPGELDLLGRFLFSDPVTQSFRVEVCPLAEHAAKNLVEIAYHPGVTDPVADEILRSARELGVSGIEAASTGQRYEISCADGSSLSTEELGLLASRLLANPVVQRYAVGPIEPSFPGKDESTVPVELLPLHSLDDEGLKALNFERRAALDFEELLAIRSYFASEGRPCTDVEFEMIAQTWSEHCFHKTFKALIDVEGGEKAGLPPKVDNILKSYIKAATDEIAAPWIVSAFKDNAGIMEFDNEFDISFKVETHNHPSAIEPFGGANTGVGGVIRDVVAVSARPIAVTDVLCFGRIGEGDADAPGAGLSVEHIRSGVVAGVQDYGNKMGIPTVNGGIHYHAKYASNPLVYCGCAGIAPKGAFYSRPRTGDRIVVLGGRTGRDGIRGATFSSMTMDGATFETAGTSVQIGAPIVEKKVTEAILAARDAGLYSGITDCGAGGLSSAVGEMASDLGGSVDLSEVRLKYSGLAPWEIWLSEAQERMVIAVPPENMEALAAICDGNDVEFCDLGFFTGDGRLVVRHRNEKILDLSCEFLHHGMPQRRLRAVAPQVELGGSFGAGGQATPPTLIPPLDKLYAEMMSHNAIASKEWAIRRYDHEVQGATKIGPFAGSLQSGPSDAAVIKPLETKGRRGIAISNGFNPRYGEADSYNAAASAIDEAVRNAVASGADPDHIAIVDNFCWGDPQKPENLWTLLRAAQACKDISLAHRAPFFCGKDSFNNEFEGADGERIAIPPSLLISAMGIVPDIACAPTTDLKSDSGILYLVGEFSPIFAASVLQDILSETLKSGTYGGKGPAFSHAAPAVYRVLHTAMRDSLVLSCHDLSDGGLGAALAEMCLGGGLGASIDLRSLSDALSALEADGEVLPRHHAEPGLDALILFGETNGCLLVEVAPGKAEKFKALMAGLPCRKIGHCAAESRIEVRLTGGGSLSAGLSDLEKAYMAESAMALGDLAEDDDDSGDIL